MGLFNGALARKRKGNGSPQYNPGVKPAEKEPAREMQVPYNGESISNAVRFPHTLTTGFDENDADARFELHYTNKAQPDVGGALNFSYDVYGLPLNDVCGPWMVARNPTKPIGSFPLAYMQVSVPTNIGGLIPGQIISQPLLDPNNPGSGFDIYD